MEKEQDSSDLIGASMEPDEHTCETSCGFLDYSLNLTFDKVSLDLTIALFNTKLIRYLKGYYFSCSHKN